MKRYVDTFKDAGFGQEFAWLDLANTLEWDGYGNLTDHLRDPSWLVLILKHWNFAAQVPRSLPMGKLIALRALLRRKTQFPQFARRARSHCSKFVFESTCARETVPAPKWSALRACPSASRLALDTLALRCVFCRNAGARPTRPFEVLCQ
jgi:hypothetical protein